MLNKNEAILKYEPLWREWKVDSFIGAGSYGRVYKIYKEKDGQRIEAAAKFISIPKDEDELEHLRETFDFETEEEAETFLRDRLIKYNEEISLMKKLSSAKNIVKYEADVTEEKPDGPGWDIIVRMECLTPLNKKYFRTHDFTRNDVVKLGVDIANAIKSCHEVNTIHRDVKIANIFVDNDGNYKLGDFGVSKVATGTMTGTLAGSSDYIAPEVEKHQKYNENVDIYSLGIVLYKLLNNLRIPFAPTEGVMSSEDHAIANEKRIRGEEKLPLPKYADGKLGKVILKACAHDRLKRYPSADKLISDLQPLLGTLSNEVILGKKVKATEDSITTLDTPESLNTIPDVGSTSSRKEKNIGTVVPDNFEEGPKTIMDADSYSGSKGSKLAAGAAAAAQAKDANENMYYGFDFDEESKTIQEFPGEMDSGTISETGGRIDQGGIGVEVGKETIGKSESGEKRRKRRALAAVCAALLILGVGVIGGYSYVHRAIHVSDIQISPAELTVTEEETAQVQITILPANTTDEIVVESSDPKLLAVTAGEIVPGEAQTVNVTGITPGTAEIVVKGGKTESSVEVTIEKRIIPVEDIELTVERTQLYVGDMLYIVRKAVVIPEDATDQTVTYKSSDDSILAIGQDGVGTGRSPGTVTVTVSAGEFSKELEVTVKPVPQVSKPSTSSGSSGKSSGSSSKKSSGSSKKWSGGSSGKSGGSSGGSSGGGGYDAWQ